MEETLEETISKQFKVFYDSISKLIPDQFQRINVTAKMVNSDFDEFEYFGDKYMTMDDVWSGLKDEDRLALLGGLMNTNYVHFKYGKYKEILLSLARMIDMRDGQKDEMEKQIKQMLVPEKKTHDYIS